MRKLEESGKDVDLRVASNILANYSRIEGHFDKIYKSFENASEYKGFSSDS